jgi:hypothetical protein
MAGIDHLRTALDEVRKYREETLCGYCRDVADTVIDSLATTIETDGLVHEIIERHPRTFELPSVRDSLHETRDLARRQLAPPPRPPPPVARRLEPLGLRSAVREVGDGIRPRKLLGF